MVMLDIARLGGHWHAAASWPGRNVIHQVSCRVYNPAAGNPNPLGAATPPPPVGQGAGLHSKNCCDGFRRKKFGHKTLLNYVWMPRRLRVCVGSEATAGGCIPPYDMLLWSPHQFCIGAVCLGAPRRRVPATRGAVFPRPAGGAGFVREWIFTVRAAWFIRLRYCHSQPMDLVEFVEFVKESVD